jgi:hypothetical protein
VSVEHEIEEAVRAYFEAPDHEAYAFATGELAEFLERTNEVWFTEAKQTLGIRRFDVEHLDETRAEVALDARVQIVEQTPDGDRATTSYTLQRVALQRVGGAWKIGDYVSDGRARSDAMRPHAAGVQEVKGLRVTTIGASLSAEWTSLFLRVENKRETPAQFEWGALGIPRRSSWRWFRFDTPPWVAFQPGTVTAIPAAAPKGFPVSTRELRVLLVEKGERVGFDFVVDLEPETDVEVAQSAPDSLPLRVRYARSPLSLVPLALLLLVVFWLGSWPALGLALAGGGGLILARIVWNRLRGRSLPVRHAIVVGAAPAAAGVVMIWAGGGLPFGGCPSRSETRAPADRFAHALLTQGRDAAARTMWPGTEPIQNDLPRLRLVSPARARRILATGQLQEGCLPFPVPQLPGFPAPPADEPCVVYELPTELDSSSSTGQLVVFLGCHEDRWQVTGFG